MSNYHHKDSLGCRIHRAHEGEDNIWEYNHHHEHHDCECSHHEHHECGCGCDHHDKKIHNLLIRAGISILLIVFSLFVSGVVNKFILSISYLVIAYDVLSSAFKNIIKGKAFDENFLMSLASITALLVSFITDKAHIDPYDGILVIVLYQIGEYIQHSAVDKSKKSITNMLDLDVEFVTIITDNVTKKINVKSIKVDDIIVVMPGDKIVVDGEIIHGASSLNTSALTGESLPRDVYVGDYVLSGCINNDGLLHLKAKTTFNKSTTAKVKEIVEKANSNKAKLDRFFTKFAKVYTPIVIAISLFIMFVLPIFFGFEKHFLTFLYKGLAFMVISCPCALVISIPLAYFMGIGKCARNQILVKGASYLEILSDVDAILFDKTGTLTKGEFIVYKQEAQDIELMNNLLYSCEKNFTHTIAKSITNYLKDKATEIIIDDLVNIPGYGIKAKYDEKIVLIGNYKLLRENNILLEEINSNTTAIYVSLDGKFLGYILIEDELKEDAFSTIEKLINNYEIQIISGDKKESVERVAEGLKINNYHYELLPEEKLEVLNKIKNNKNVIYVGDGINDAACLLSATVGVAMHSIGSDIAISASDIVLMDDKIASVSNAIKISKKTKKIVIQNIIFSLAVKTLVMVLAVVFTIPMYVAIVADVGVAMLAIMNSFRILLGKLEK